MQEQVNKQIEALTKACSIAEKVGVKMLKSKPNSRTNEANHYSNLAMEASDTLNFSGGNPDDGDRGQKHKAAADLHRKAAQAMSDIGDTMATKFHKDMAAKHDGHHKAYTRTSINGKVSNISEK